MARTPRAGASAGDPSEQGQKRAQKKGQKQKQRKRQKQRRRVGEDHGGNPPAGRSLPPPRSGRSPPAASSTGGTATRSRSSSRHAAPAAGSSRGGSPRAGSRRTSPLRRRRSARSGRRPGMTRGDRGLPRRDPLLLRVGGRADPQDGPFLPDASYRRQRRGPRRRDGGDPLVPARARAQARRVPRRARRARAGGRDAALSAADVAIGIAIGLVSGVLSGLFGVGGGIVMTPGIQVLLGAPPIVALATPLPVIFPTALTGALAYRRRGEIDMRAAAWLVGPGVVGAALGAWLTGSIDTRLLLIVTAVLLGWQAIAILRKRERRHRRAAGDGPDPRRDRGPRRPRLRSPRHRGRARDRPPPRGVARDAAQAGAGDLAPRDRGPRGSRHRGPCRARPSRPRRSAWRWWWVRCRGPGWAPRSRSGRASGRSASWSDPGSSLIAIAYAIQQTAEMLDR